MTTTCVSPPELDDKQLLAYLDAPEANPEIGLHITQCSYCHERAEALDGFQKRLTNRLYRITCPSPTELGEYHLRLLSSSQMLVVRQHLTECPHCSREIAELEAFLGQEAGLFGKAKKLIARLFDRGGAPGQRDLALGALRGESKRPLMFEANGLLITLDLQPGAEGQTSVLGQVVAEDSDRWTGAQVQIQQADGSKETARVDDLGAFQYEAVFSGPVQIVITSIDGIEVQIPEINI